MISSLMSCLYPVPYSKNTVLNKKMSRKCFKIVQFAGSDVGPGGGKKRGILKGQHIKPEQEDVAQHSCGCRSGPLRRRGSALNHVDELFHHTLAFLALVFAVLAGALLHLVIAAPLISILSHVCSTCVAAIGYFRPG